MNRSEMKARKQALKQALKERQRALRAEYLSRPEVQKVRRRRALFRLILLLIVLLLLLLIRCDCGPGVPMVVEPEPVEKTTPDAGTPRPIFKTTVKALPRSAYGNKERAVAGWVEQFQIQVVARSPRLAECFVGVDRPGALRWTCALNADSGAVSEHELEPVGAEVNVTAAQRQCVLDVLSKPGYALTDVPKQGLPQRIGFVLEF